jgi:hypothetical protein
MIYKNGIWQQNTTAYSEGSDQFASVQCTAAANAALPVTLWTVTGGNIFIERAIIRSNGATTTDLTSVQLQGGVSGRAVIIPSSLGIRTSLAAEGQQVSQGKLGLENYTLGMCTFIPSGQTIQLVLAGTGATAVNLQVILEYHPMTNGARLA